MQATLGLAKTEVKREGTKANIPNNDIAKLMYYLNCLVCVLQCDDIGSKYTDYIHYYNLTEKEKEDVIEFALIFNPKILIELNIFILDSGPLLPEYNNEFYRIEDERIGIHANEQVVIGGRSIRVLKVMVCNKQWLEQNYFTPMKNINNRKKNNYNYSSNTKVFNYNSSNNGSETGCYDCIKRNKKSCIITIVIFVIILVVDIIYYVFLDKKKSKKNK